MQNGSTYLILGLILLIIIILIVLFLVFNNGDNDDNDKDEDEDKKDDCDEHHHKQDNDCACDDDKYHSKPTEHYPGEDGKGHDGICNNITNVWHGKKLNRVRIHRKGKCGDLLSPSAVDSNGLCFLGNTSQPLSVVDSSQEPHANWGFDDYGYLEYTDNQVFKSYGLGGIGGKFYLTYTQPRSGDSENSIEAWYGFRPQPNEHIYAASMTILPPNSNKSCNDQLCVSWEGANKNNNGDVISTYIDGKKYYLTANNSNSFVYWSNIRKKNQLWCVQITKPKNQKHRPQRH